MPELNPVTRTRLWYIAVFLAIDSVVALYISASIPPLDPIALPSIIFGLIMGVAAGSLVAFLLATKIDVDGTNLKRERTRE